MRKKLSFMKTSILTLFTLLIGALLASSNAGAAEQRINLPAMLSQGVPILIEFGRDWCIPCKYMKPILDDMARSYAGKAIVVTGDMDANKDLVRKFQIRMMPTQVFILPDGKEFFRNEGTLERDQIVQIFSKMGVPAPGQAPPRTSSIPGAYAR